jgi:hypothetical protein
VPQVIAYPNTDPTTGEPTVSIVVPVDTSLSLEEHAQRAVPPGTPYRVLDTADLPTTREWRDAWEFDELPGNPPVKINEVRRLALSAARVRRQRDELLVESDWSQLPDVPAPVREPWAEYRQDLRDVPTQSGFPDNVVWPGKPR